MHLLHSNAWNRVPLYFLFFAINILSGVCHASLPPTHQTQGQLKKLELKINKLKHDLASAQDKQNLLHNELSKTEKQIGEGIHQLHTLENEVEIKSYEMKKLQHTTQRLSKQLASQQEHLANHVRARYQMGEYQALKWLVDQESPYQINRLLTYYQYFIKSRQKLIHQISQTQKRIQSNQEKINQELAKRQVLRTQLTAHQQELENHKTYHKTLIDSLNTHIKSTQSTLTTAEKDKENLTQLLKKLAQQSMVRTTQSFTKMRKKLPLPVQTSRRSIITMNQGVTFFADEGAVVTAVFPGKVVFSDWLNGYGLLLILDHGQGFMSLYAHNQSLYKHKGEQVYQGEQVGRVGHSGGIKQNGLYFEIRVRGKAVPPLEWIS